MKSKLFNKNGTALPAMMMIIIVMMLLASVLLLYSQRSTFSAKREEQGQKAFYIAETGTSNYLFNLNKDPDYFINNTHPAENDWQDFDQGQYKLSVTPLENAVGVDILVTARTPVKTKTKTIYQYKRVKATLQKRSFLKYIFFTDHETSEGSGNPIWFISGDTLRGPLHSNDLININGSPVFEGKVTTARTFNPGVGSAVFEQGYEENVQPLELPTTNSQLKNWSQNGGYYYYGQTTIGLNANGTIDVNNNNVLSTGPTGSALSMPSNGVVYVDGQTSTKYNSSSGNIFIDGTLSGELTIASLNDIFITGDIRYNNTNNDMLGLISNNYIYINHYNNRGQDVAPTNITIHGALASLNHSFTFENYRNGPAKGTITTLGSMVQRFRGPVGTFYSGGSKASGYSKNYNYDQRMLYSEPPHFIEPLNSGFYMSNWEELPSREND